MRPGVFQLMGGLVRSTVEKATAQALERPKRQVEAATKKALAKKRTAKKRTAKV